MNNKYLHIRYCSKVGQWWVIIIYTYLRVIMCLMVQIIPKTGHDIIRKKSSDSIRVYYVS